MNYKPLREVKLIVVHCSATRSTQDIGVEEIRRWHRDRGWFDIGYHYVIRRDGTLEVGRPEERPGAHARGYNHLSLGICLAGGVAADGRTAENNFTGQQFVTLRETLEDLLERHPGATVLGHRDLPRVAKACPSFDVREWWALEQL